MRPIAILITLALVGTCGQVAAQEGAGNPSLVLRFDEVQEVYPPKAKAIGLGGSAIITCKGSSERFWSCRIKSETPLGEGFGDAGLALVSRYQVVPPEAPERDLAEPFNIEIGFLTPQVRTVRAADVEYSLPLKIKGPSLDDLYEAWPRAARFSGVQGKVELWCTVALDGRLKDCAVGNIRGHSSDFGEAALKMAPLFQYRPALKNGAPVAMSMPVSVSFICDSRCRPFGAAPSSSTQRWLAVPTPGEVMAAYPPAARTRGVDGHVRLACDVEKDGKLTSCRAVAESPKGQGFAVAALGLAPLFRLPPSETAAVSLSVTFDDRAAVANWFGGKAYLPPPTKAGQTAISGKARVKCRVSEGGGLQACAVTSSDPAEPEIDQEALKNVADLYAELWTSEGRSTVGSILELQVDVGRFKGVSIARPGSAEAIVAPEIVSYKPQVRLADDMDMARFYPQRAKRDEVEGSVTLKCKALKEGRPKNCAVALESLFGYGFGDAALAMSQFFRFSPETIDGISTEEPFEIPVIFKVPR